MPEPTAGAPSRSQAISVFTAFLVSSALGFALLGVFGRWLPPDLYARFLAMWGLIFAFGSVLGAVEPEIARQSTHATLARQNVPFAAVQMLGLAMGASLVVLVVLLLTPAGRMLTGGSVALTVMTFVAMSGFSVQIMTRGVLLGRNAIVLYVVVIVLEAFLRLVLALLIVGRQFEPSLGWGVAAIVIGCFGWVPVVHRVLPAIAWGGPSVPWRRAASTVAALAMANGCAALVITGYPAVATAVIGQVEELGDLFALITLCRVPLVLLAPLQVMTVPVVVRLLRSGQRDRVRRMVTLTVVASLVAALAGGLLAYALGPWAMRLFLGGQYDPSRLMYALAIAATCILAVAILQSAVLIALERYWLITGCWLIAVVVAAVVMTALTTSAEMRGLWGFVAASVVAALAMGTAVRRVPTPPERVESVSLT